MMAIEIVEVISHAWPAQVVVRVPPAYGGGLLLGNSFWLGQLEFRFLNYVQRYKRKEGWRKVNAVEVDQLKEYFIRAGFLNDSLRERARLYQALTEQKEYTSIKWLYTGDDSLMSPALEEAS